MPEIHSSLYSFLSKAGRVSEEGKRENVLKFSQVHFKHLACVPLPLPAWAECTGPGPVKQSYGRALEVPGRDYS